MNTARKNARWAIIGYALGMALWASLLSTPEAHAQAEIGRVLFARGAATASREASIRLMGNGTPLYEKDLLTTGRGSIAIIKFNDDTRMTIRPNSVVRVDQYSQKIGSESFLLSMFSGGLRAITGLISKREPDAFKLHTPLATMGIRGTDFSARLCTDDCAAEAGRVVDEQVSLPADNAVARLAFVKGGLTATSIDGKEREVHLGGAVYEGDLLHTGDAAFAVLAFRDESRITLQADTRFQIERHAYTENKPDEAGALMRLFQGGIRAVSGLISKVRPSSYTVETPVGIISTRGTNFDIICPTRDCFVITRAGLLAVDFGEEINDLRPDSTAFLRGNAPPRYDIPVPPKWKGLLDRTPKPEDIQIDPKLFETVSRKPDAGTLNVVVYDKGQVDVISSDGTRLSLGKGESVHVGSNGPVRLGGTPKFVSKDTYNISPDIDVESGTLPLNNMDSGGPNSQECTF